MKKISYFILTIFVITLLTGCSASTNIALTEDESNAIAQYCAYLMMKYDKNGTSAEKLLDLSDLKDIVEERNQESQTSNPAPTIKPEAPSVSDVPNNESSDTSVQSPDSSSDHNSGDINYTDAIDELLVKHKANVSSISEAIGLTDFRLEYNSLKTLISISSTTDYYSFNAPSGSYLGVVELSLTNVSSETPSFNPEDYNSAYKLILPDGSALDPAITLRDDDLRFGTKEVQKGSTKNVELIFYIPERFITQDEVNSFILKVIGNPKSDSERVYVTKIQTNY